jgi:hypothetical protein
MTGEVATPTCPRCGSAPAIVLGNVTQAFCGNEDCDVLTWNPRESVEYFERTARPVRLQRGDQ